LPSPLPEGTSYVTLSHRSTSDPDARIEALRDTISLPMLMLHDVDTCSHCHNADLHNGAPGGGDFGCLRCDRTCAAQPPSPPPRLSCYGPPPPLRRSPPAASSSKRDRLALPLAPRSVSAEWGGSCSPRLALLPTPSALPPGWAGGAAAPSPPPPAPSWAAVRRTGAMRLRGGGGWSLPDLAGDDAVRELLPPPPPPPPPSWLLPAFRAADLGGLAMAAMAIMLGSGAAGSCREPGVELDRPAAAASPPSCMSDMAG
jgi:hypothetical protein